MIGAGAAAGDGRARIDPVNLITATPLRRLPLQRLGFRLSKAPGWLARAFDEEPLSAQLKTFNFLHTARWVYLGRLPRTDPAQPREPWAGPRWVVYVANYDGPWEPYFGTFMEAMAEGVYDVWGQSIGYPGFPAAGTANDLRRWLATRLPCSDHYYCAYPWASANDVRAAVRVRRELGSLTVDLRLAGVDGSADVTAPFDHLLTRLRQCLGPMEPPWWPRPDGSSSVLPDGSVRGFVAVFPVRAGREATLREQLAALPTATASPFRQVPGVHFARLALLDRAIIGYHPRPDDQFQTRNSYLLMAADFDAGPASERPDERFVRAVHGALGEHLDRIWQHCWGFTAGAGPDVFADLALRCRRPFLREFIDCPDQSLQSVLAALDGHGPFLDLVRRRSRGQPVEARELYRLLE